MRRERQGPQAGRALPLCAHSPPTCTLSSTHPWEGLHLPRFCPTTHTIQPSGRYLDGTGPTSPSLHLPIPSWRERRWEAGSWEGVPTIQLDYPSVEGGSPSPRPGPGQGRGQPPHRPPGEPGHIRQKEPGWFRPGGRQADQTGGGGRMGEGPWAWRKRIRGGYLPQAHPPLTHCHCPHCPCHLCMPACLPATSPLPLNSYPPSPANPHPHLGLPPLPSPAASLLSPPATCLHTLHWEPPALSALCLPGSPLCLTTSPLTACLTSILPACLGPGITHPSCLPPPPASRQRMNNRRTLSMWFCAPNAAVAPPPRCLSSYGDVLVHM